MVYFFYATVTISRRSVTHGINGSIQCFFYLIEDMKLDEDKDWLQWYSWVLAGLGAAFLVWGFFLDLSATQWRRQRRKGDR